MNRALILLGPTGVGKTGLSLLLAEFLSTEIISADSMQIYRHMDIGTAKPSLKEREMIRHHMIDIIEPSESYSSGRYLEDVSPIIEGLCSAGKTPLIVGGTGLYIKALTRGLFEGPSSDSDLRENLLSLEKERSGALYEYLSVLDPETAKRTEKNNIRRIIRAIEVCVKTGSTMSLMQKVRTRPLPYEFFKIGLTRERQELYEIIDRRTDDMFKTGLVDEVRAVLNMNPDRTPLQAIGYKEVARYLNNEIDLSEAARLVKRNSRRYAKRQFTWYRQEEDINWIDVTGMKTSEEIFEKVKQSIRL